MSPIPFPPTHSLNDATMTFIQANIKRDPPGYADEFALQVRHYKALLNLFLMSPSQDSKELAELATFLAHVSTCYPQDTASLPAEIVSLLDSHASILDPGLRISLVKSLILLRNKNQLASIDILPPLFRLFRVPDKALRRLVFRHVVADIKAANKKARNERFNRSVQNFMYDILSDEHEGTAKRGLAVVTEMWRRGVWRDARTVNVIAEATAHKSPRIMLAAVKFFLGQDIEDNDNSDSDNDDHERGENKRDDGITKPTGPTKEEVYAAYHKGTVSSKKRKQKKIQRVLASVKKASRKEEGAGNEGFAALQLLHDPQAFAEKLFYRLQKGGERFETRLAIMAVTSRAIGIHKLLLLNFYPFLQRYISPSQREVTSILAALVQSCHDLVPPDALAPVLRQLVDQFVHDRARPEVMTIGLKTVREICTRTPLVMNVDLLSDLTEYKKFRNKEVSSAARGLISLFRELAPGMLAKRDRGRGADLETAVPMYGAAKIADRVEGVDLLEQAIADGKIGSDGDLMSGEDEDEDEDEEYAELEEEEEEEEDSEPSDEDEIAGDENAVKEVIKPQPESLASLKKQLSAVKVKTSEEVPLEWGRILTEEDFETIRQLKHKRLVTEAMAKHGLKSASKRAKALEAAEEEAEELLAFKDKLSTANERRVNTSALVGRHKYRKDKEERMASVLEGREGREFGAKSSLKKSKTGGLSNREKDKRKRLPLAARSGQVKKRLIKGKTRHLKNFKGHVRG